MRDKEYIERGALVEMCKRQIECEWNTIASPGTWAHAFEDFGDLVEQTPAADVVEVRYGEWVEHFGFDCWHYDCPFCDDGYATQQRDETPPNYCSNCGARLTLERKEQT